MMTIDGTVRAILGYVSLSSATLASSPETSAPMSAAASGGTPPASPSAGIRALRSTSESLSVFETAPMQPAAAAICTGLLNMIEKPNTPTKLMKARSAVSCSAPSP